MGEPATVSMHLDPVSLAAKLTAALIEHSWVRVTNHGIAPCIVDDAYGTAVDFFSRPEAFKRSVDIRKSTNHRGFVDIHEKGDYADEGGIRRYEAFDVGRDLPRDHPQVMAETPLLGPNQWPDVEGFAAANRRLFAALDLATRRLLDLIEVGLGIHPGTISQHRHEPLSQMRYLNYLPPPDDAPVHAAMGAHTDYEFITAIVDRPHPGSALEVLDNGQWRSIPPEPTSLVILAGDLLETVSNGQISAAYHRVADIPGARFSIPFFAGADYAAIVSPAVELVGPEGALREPVAAGQHLLTQLLRDFPYLRQYVTISLTDDTEPADVARMSQFERRHASELFA